MADVDETRPVDSTSPVELVRTERYVLHDAIARGGMASVHIGVLAGSFGFSRVVAIKRLHGTLCADSRFVSMLIDEARVVSRIRHVNVVPTLDIIERQGEVFLIMDYVRGASLAKLIELAKAQGTMIPLSVAATILVGTLRGLHAAHEATALDGTPLSVVHRDVSPQNVLVGVGGVPRIIDFGVARAAGQTTSTSAGEFKGKLAYAAPEQLGGGDITRRSDVFAAGILLWELITATRLFQRDSQIGTIRAVLGDEVMAPSTKLADDPATTEARPPAQVQALGVVALRALQRNAQDRFESAQEMAEAIEAAMTLASTSTVGSWVLSLAGTHLAEEHRLVSRAESSTRKQTESSEAARLEEPTRIERSRPAPIAESTTATRSNPAVLPTTLFAAIALAAALGAAVGSASFGFLAR